MMQQETVTARKVYFELTNACNFRCDFCPIQVSTRKPELMDYELFRAGVDQVVEDRIAGTAGFHVLGEPLLYPRVQEAVHHAQGRGLRTVLTTNGSLLTREMLRGLIEAGLGTLVISLQMLDAQSHQCREARLSYEEYYARAIEAVGQVCQAGQDTEVQIVAMSTWSRRLFDVDRPMRIGAGGHAWAERLASLFHDLYRAAGKRAPVTEVQRAVLRLNRYRPWTLRFDERVSASILPFMDWGNAFTSRKVYPARFGYCSYALSNIGVLSNGEVTICCGDYDGRTSLGNLRREPLTSLLTSEPARAIRNGLDRMRLVHPQCQRCFGSTNPARAVVKGLASICIFSLAGFRAGGEQRETALLSPKLLEPDSPQFSGGCRGPVAAHQAAEPVLTCG
jgi:MoaA/NifB/PqqE/SkfB family radical SAM enzyme